MLARIQEYTPKPLAVSDPVVKQPAPAEEFSVSLDQATLTLLLDEMSRLGLDTSKLKISSDPAQPSQQSATASFPTATRTSAASPEAPFVPTFRENAQVVSAYGGSWGLNSTYFPTRETAKWIAQKYGTGEVVEVPYEGSGGPFYANASEFQIRLKDGRMVNAGFLADCYRRMPEAQFPGLADQMIRASLV
jgi:hypothetical protein